MESYFSDAKSFPLIEYSNDQTSIPAIVLQKLVFHYYVFWGPQGELNRHGLNAGRLPS